MRAMRIILTCLLAVAVTACADPLGAEPSTFDRLDEAHPESDRLVDAAWLDRLSSLRPAPGLLVQAPTDAGPGEPVFLRVTDAEGLSPDAAVRWRQTEGPAVMLHDDDQPSAWFRPPAVFEPVALAFAVEVEAEGAAGASEVMVLISGDDRKPRGEPEPTPPQPSLVPELIVFRADRDLQGRSEIYRVNLDGTGLVRLNAPLPPGFDVTSYAISPDARHVAFTVTDETTAFDVYVATIDGARAVRVNEPDTFVRGTVTDASWAPDGSRVAFGLIDGRVLTVRPDGTGLTERAVDDGLGGEVDPTSIAWSPDSDRVAYMGDYNVPAVMELFVADADGTGRRRLSGPMVRGGDVISFAWSPAGDRIAYLADQYVDTERELFSVRPAGGEPVRLSGDLAPSGSVATDYAWSPDGARVLYQAGQLVAAELDLFTTRADGSENVRVATTSGGADTIVLYTWSPSGDAILYRATGLGAGTYLTGPGGEGTRVVYGPFFGGPTESGLGVFSPDGERVVLRLLDLATRSVTFRVVALNDASLNLSFSADLVATIPDWHPDSTHLLYPDEDISLLRREVRTYRLADGANPVVSSAEPERGPGTRKFTRSGDRIVYLGAGSTITPRRVYVTSPDADVPALDVSGSIVGGGNVRSFALP